jgi:3-oxoacyl-[acyl-carrier-protein] synthase I
MTNRRVHLAAIGAATALGRDAWSSAAAVRAGIAAFVDHPYMIDEGGRPMKTCAASWLDDELAGLPRFLTLLESAVEQALRPAAQSGAGRPVLGIALGVPAQRPGLPDDLAPALLAALSRSFDHPVSDNAVFAADHASGIFALDRAYRKISSGELNACIVACVDSYVEPKTLEWLESQGELHAAGFRRNSWGITPGEAAGAMLIASDEALDAFEARSLGRVSSVACGFEPKHMRSQSVCIGQGLTAVCNGTLAALPQHRQATDIYCDLNPQPYRADEYGFAALRIGEKLRDAADLTAPADCWGDIGAASGVLLTILATCAANKRYAEGADALIWTSSPGGERGAALLDFGIEE